MNAQNQVIDISHPIIKGASCSFAAVDTAPQLSFEEGDSHGVTFVTSRVDNLHSNICSHIDFPGHLATLGRKFPKPVGMYPIERFIGKVFIADFSDRLNRLSSYFDKTGKLTVSLRDEAAVMSFLRTLDALAITKEDLVQVLKAYDIPASSLTGLFLYGGLSKWWRYEKFESWEYAYFYGPFLSEEACDYLVENKLSFVGVDAFQLENPIINFNGHELLLVLHTVARNHVSAQLEAIELFSNHSALLGNDILIYENLKIPSELKNQVVQFSGAPLNMQLEGMNDNALVRPYVFMLK